MHILFLGTSNDLLRPPGSRTSRVERIQELLEEALASPVTVSFRQAWPNAALPSLLDRWITAEEPDLVYLCVNGYAYLYDSVPLRLRRRYGRAGAMVASVAERAGSSERLSWNAPFRALRAAATKAIGSGAHFTPAEIVATVEACIRVAARREGLLIGVRPSWGDVSYGRTPAEAERKEQIRRAVQRSIAEACSRYHVYCEIRERAHWQDHPGRVDAADDGVHQNTAGLEFTAQALAASILKTIEAGAGER